MVVKMTINGTEVEVKEGGLCSLFTPPKPKKRLVNDWGDAPTEGDTTEPLFPSAKDVELVVGVSDKEKTTLIASLTAKEQSVIVFLGVTLSLRVTRVAVEDFSEKLSEVRLEGVIDTPRVTQSTTPTTLSETLLEGSQTAEGRIVIKPGASEEVTGMIGGLYVTNGKVVEDRRPMELKVLVKAKSDTLWSVYDRVTTALFAPLTMVEGVPAEYRSSTTTALDLYGEDFFWELDINLLTL